MWKYFTFKVGPLTVTQKKFFNFWDTKFVVWLCVGKAKTTICLKRKTECSTEVFPFALCSRLPLSYSWLESQFIWELWNAQLKEIETFWQHNLKIYYPVGLNEKNIYLFWWHTARINNSIYLALFVLKIILKVFLIIVYFWFIYLFIYLFILLGIMLDPNK